MKRADGRRVCDGSPESMHGAAGAPPQLTDGACVAAQSTDVAALRHTLQARPLALRLHRERAIGAKSTDLCAVDFHVGRAQRADNRGSRMLSRTRAHRASGGPGGGRPSSPPERPWPGSGIKGGVFFRPSTLPLHVSSALTLYCLHPLHPQPCNCLSCRIKKKAVPSHNNRVVCYTLEREIFSSCTREAVSCESTPNLADLGKCVCSQPCY